MLMIGRKAESGLAEPKSVLTCHGTSVNAPRGKEVVLGYCPSLSSSLFSSSLLLLQARASNVVSGQRLPKPFRELLPVLRQSSLSPL